MSEIKVNLNALDDGIDRLKALKKECLDYENLPSKSFSGGKTINELEQVINKFNEIDQHMIQLINNSIRFMMNVKYSFDTSDQDIANNIINS